MGRLFCWALPRTPLTTAHRPLLAPAPPSTTGEYKYFRFYVDHAEHGFALPAVFLHACAMSEPGTASGTRLPHIEWRSNGGGNAGSGAAGVFNPAMLPAAAVWLAVAMLSPPPPQCGTPSPVTPGVGSCLSQCVGNWIELQ